MTDRAKIEAVAWCFCNGVGTCLACRIEKAVRVDFGTQGLDFLRSAVTARSAPDRKREDVVRKIDKALQVVFALCRGDADWTMSIPVRPDTDTDVVLADALNSARHLLVTPVPVVPLTDAEIVAIRDEHLPSQGEPFDCLAFAKDVLAAAKGGKVSGDPPAPAREPA